MLILLKEYQSGHQIAIDANDISEVRFFESFAMVVTESPKSFSVDCDDPRSFLAQINDHRT